MVVEEGGDGEVVEEGQGTWWGPTPTPPLKPPTS